MGEAGGRLLWRRSAAGAHAEAQIAATFSARVRVNVTFRGRPIILFTKMISGTRVQARLIGNPADSRVTSAPKAISPPSPIVN